MSRQGCAFHLDDVVVYSDTWKTHLERIVELLIRLAEARLMVNLAKFEFARATVTGGTGATGEIGAGRK